MIKQFLLSILILFLVSCEKKSTINFPVFKEQPVANALLANDSLFSIHLSKAVKTNSADIPNIDDAIIDLYRNDSLIETLTQSLNGVYPSTTVIIHENEKYKVDIKTTSGNLSTETFIPAKPVFHSDFRIDSAGFDSNGNQFDEMELTVNDDVTVVNYYEVAIKVYNIQTTQFNNSFFAGLTSDDEIFKREGINYWGTTILFSDDGFNGLQKKLLIKYFLNGSLDNNGNLVGYNYDSEIILNNVTKDYYEYKKSLKVHLENQGGDIFGGDPVTVYSNITGGLGIFAGYSTATDTLKD